MTPLTDKIDLCVIGGGINGAGVAYDAAMRGIRVGLYEQYDFGFGASTSTSKLAHGGLRYLENYQFKLVRESLNERNFLTQQAPHLVKPLQFLVPIYKHSKWQAWKLRVGLSIYDVLQSKSIFPKHKMTTMTDVILNVPWLDTKGLLSGASYFDAQMDDQRLIIELLRMSNHEGSIIQNYAKVESVHQKDNGLSVEIRKKSGKLISMGASSVIAATGAWGNQFKHKIVKPNKGVHIVLPDMDLTVALLLMSKKDQRVFFVMPWNGYTLIGTTDQEDDYRYDFPTVTSQDAQYLLDAINGYHIKRHWKLSDIVFSFCGYRPLVNSEEINLSKQNREDSMDWIQPNMLAISGGKYTTYRAMAKQAVDMIQKRVFPDRIFIKSNTINQSFLGKMLSKEWPSHDQLTQLTNRYHIQRESIIHLIQIYGSIYREILDIISYNPEYAVRFDIACPIVIAELKYAIVKEWVKHPMDFLFRRTHYGYFYGKNEGFIMSLLKHFNKMTSQDIHYDDLVEQIRIKSEIVDRS